MVNLYTQLLLKKLDRNDADLDVYAAFINGGLSRMQKLISDAIAYQRVLHKEGSSQETTDLNVALTKAIGALASRLAQAKATVSNPVLP